MELNVFEELWKAAKPFSGYLEDIDGPMDGYRAAVRRECLALDRLPVPDREICVLAFSEKWCPDCILNLTVLEYLAAEVRRVTVRVMGREGHEDIIGGLNESGKAYIPTLVFFDSEKHLGTFVERPRVLKEQLDGCSQAERIQLMQMYKSGGFQQETLDEYLDLMTR